MYRYMTRHALGIAGAAGAAMMALGAPAVAAQDYPSKPLTLVVPYAPGGGVDTVGRIVAQSLGEQLGQTVVVENRPGAGSNVGSDYVVRSAADGYTLLLASPATAVNASLYKNMPFDPRTDLVPVSLVGEVPSVLIVNNDLQAGTLQELVELARAAPGKLHFGSGGNGTSEHLAAEMFKASADLDLVHVPYKGGAAAMTDLLGGRIEMMIINQITALPLIQGDKVRALAVAGADRSEALPDVPTFAEQGYEDYRVSVWWGVMAPAGTPEPVVQRLAEGVAMAIESPQAKPRFDDMGVQLSGAGPAEFGAFLEEETERWAEIVQTSVEQIE